MTSAKKIYQTIMDDPENVHPTMLFELSLRVRQERLALGEHDFPDDVPYELPGQGIIRYNHNLNGN